MFKTKKSDHPLQQRLDQLGTAKRVTNGCVLLVGTLIGLIITIAFYPSALYSLLEMLMGKSVVNINYMAFFLGGGVPICYMTGLLAFSVLYYKRVVIPAELKPWVAKSYKYSIAWGLILTIGGGGGLSAITIPLIWANGYSHCSEMTKGSGWDSYWVKDPAICSSYSR